MAQVKQKPTKIQLQERKGFDEEMRKKFHGIRMFTRLTIESVEQIAHFNIKRFAFWIAKNQKYINQELSQYLKSKYQTLGGLSHKYIV